MKKLFAVLFLAVTSTTFSQKKMHKSVNFFEEEQTNPSQIHTIASTLFSKNREIIVHLPKTYDEHLQKRYPVLYVLDGKRNLKATIFIAEILASKRKIPEIIIVGLPAGETRDEDYTPNNMLMNSETGNGNAARFQKYLDSELIPYIDDHFRTESYRILSGHSRGGLFTINHMLSESALFNAHFAFSPALYLNDYGIIDDLILKLGDEKINSRFLYANAGGIENLKIKNSLHKLEAALNTLPPKLLQWKTQRFEDDSHGTTTIGGYYHALKKLYSHWDNPWKRDTITLESIIKDYVLLSKEFEYPIYPAEYRLNNIGYHFIKLKDFDKAIAAFEQNIKYYPNSANVYSSYADALESKGDLNSALKALEKAVSLLGKNKTELDQSIHDHYKDLKKKILKTGN